MIPRSATGTLQRLAKGFPTKANRSVILPYRDAVSSVISHERGHRNIFINIGPMNTDTLADQSPVTSLLSRGITQSREPFQRC